MIVFGIILLIISLYSLIMLINQPLYAKGGTGLMVEQAIILSSKPVVFLLLNLSSTIFGGGLILLSLDEGDVSNHTMLIISILGILVLGIYAVALLHANYTKVNRLIEENYKSERWNLLQVSLIINQGRVSALVRLGLTWLLMTLIMVIFFVFKYETNGEGLQPETAEEWLLYFFNLALLISIVISMIKFRDMQRTSVWKSLLKKRIIQGIPEGQLSRRKWEKDNFVGFNTMKDLDGKSILDDEGLPRLLAPLPPLYEGVEVEKVETTNLPFQRAEVNRKLEHVDVSTRMNKSKHSLQNEEVVAEVEKATYQFPDSSLSANTSQQKNEEFSKKAENPDLLHSNEPNILGKKKKRISFKW
ncbi:MAG: hypothetical protein LBV19_00310 [Streptococcaceae bacterium]|nr:hypothetical protein [Streptococcaceae bacterium]